MPEKKTNENNEDYGQVLLAWSFPEHVQYQRNKSWYIVSGSIFLLLILYSLFTANFLFTLFLVLFGLIVFLHSKRAPLKVEFKIFEDGLMVGSKFYEWTEIKNFHLVYRPPETKRLYFDLKGVLIPDISVSLENQSPLEVREILKKYLDEDTERTEETIIDKLNRRLKL